MRFFFTINLVFNLLIIFPVFSQADSASVYRTKETLSKEKGYGINLLPLKKSDFYGVAIGLFGSEILCNIPYKRTSNGMNLQLFGQGVFILFNLDAFSFKRNFSSDSALRVVSYKEGKIKIQHNGILFSGFGTFTDKINGISISFIGGMGYQINGVSINLITNKYTYLRGVEVGGVNEAYEVRGLQIGIINKSYNIKGLQIGLWNINSKRKLPIINW